MRAQSGSFFRWVKGGLLFLLHHMNGGLDKILLAVSVGWYAAAILLNLTFLYPKALILRLVTLCVLTGIAATSYLLIYRLVKSCRNETQLQEIAYTDHLTGLRNRAGLFWTPIPLWRRKTPFSLVFMDLNRFKSINDSYGHLAGDRYLCWFSKHVQELLDSQGRLYRMSGDEFVCLYTGRETPEFVKNIRLLPRVIQEEKIPFWGCSVGVSCYPEGFLLSGPPHLPGRSEDVWREEGASAEVRKKAAAFGFRRGTAVNVSIAPVKGGIVPETRPGSGLRGGNALAQQLLRQGGARLCSR